MAELQVRWPWVAWAVETEEYSGGSAIHVAWRFGPTRRMVAAVAERYEAAPAGDARDLYETREDAFMQEWGGAKFVELHRDVGQAGFLAEVGKDLCAALGRPWEGMHARLPDGRTVADAVRRLLERTAFAALDRYAGVESRRTKRGVELRVRTER
jgi:hypothetical protein